MSWFPRRRRFFRDIDEFFRDFFRDMEEFLEEIEEEFERLRRRAVEEGREEGYRVRYFGPYVYGMRITIGPDGIPRVEEFGNVRRERGRRPLISEEMEPIVDVIEREDEVRVVAELPGADKEKIDVKVVGKKVVIKASNGRKYYKEVDLEHEVDPDTAKATYKNGILEVVFKKKKRVEEEGKRIKVE
ncbi:MAG: archaeal heat shock protein Hsp20 [Acidilobaceae archaeon]